MESKVISPEVRAQKGKYLTFKIANEEYGIDIRKVREIIGVMPSAKVPSSPDFVRGVINLRGSVIPVIELRRRFFIATVTDTAETCIVVVEIMKGTGCVNLGVVVDSVSDVIDIKEEEIEPPPSFGAEVATAHILGIAKKGSGVKILINIDRVLTESALESIA